MLEDDRDSERVDLFGIVTDPTFLVGFALPILLLGAAFAILTDKDGQLTSNSWAWFLALVFAGTLGAFFGTGLIEYLLLKEALGIELGLSREAHWSAWIGLGAIFVALVERRLDRIFFRALRVTQRKIAKLDPKNKGPDAAP